MMWIGLIAGVVIGGLLWEIEGAVTLGFIGWLAGLIIKSQRTPAQPASVGVSGAAASASGIAATPGVATALVPGTLEERVARMEMALARVEARLARLDPLSNAGMTHDVMRQGAEMVAPDAAASPVAPDAARAAMVGGPIVTPDAAQAAMVGGPIPEVAEAAPGTTKETPPPVPPTPNPFIAWLTGGNTIARVGLLILFFGLAFLLKYAVDKDMFPPELRVGGVAAGGIAMLVLGWRLRFRNAGYALGLQGAGVAVLYLVTFAALRLYGLIPAEMAFVLLAGIAIFSAVLAVLQDAVALAVIGAGGGFLAPVLASTGGGNHVALFGYYLVLNLGIAAIAYFRAWRALNITGFLFTFLIGLAWGERYYRPEHFPTVEPFLVAFFLVYVAIAILTARGQTGVAAGPEQGQTGVAAGPERGRSGVAAGSQLGFRAVDGMITFGTPLVAFALQAALMRNTEFGLAFSSLAASALYLVLAAALLRPGREGWTLLGQSFIALGVVFATLAVPLALDARWTSATWALEGAAVVWVGVRQNRKVARAFGLLLQVLAGIAYVEGYRRMPASYPLVDAAFVGAAIMALAGLWIHRLLLRNAEAVTGFERKLIVPVFVWGLAWTLFAGMDEIDEHIPGDYSIHASVIFFAATAVVFGILSRRWQWAAAAWTARALLPALIVAGAFILVDQRHPLDHYGWLAWPLAFGALLWILRSIEPDKRGGYTTFLHAGMVLLAVVLGAKELHWIASEYTARHTAWSLAALGVVPALMVLLLSARAVDARWPIADHLRAYRHHVPGILALVLAAWSVFGNLTHDASSDPLPYLPLLNAVDLAHGLAIGALVAAWLAARRSAIEPPEALRGKGGVILAGGVAFIWANAILLRTLSHWFDISYNPDALMRSMLVQASISVFWALLALAAMTFATKTGRRALWMTGAALMGVVVAKLFLFDLSHVGRIEQIVSFIAVGLLMLVIGYFSPVPPRKPEAS